MFCLNCSVYLQCSESYSPWFRIMGCAHIWRSDTVKTGTQCIYFMAGILGAVILVEDSRNLISVMGQGWLYDSTDQLTLITFPPLRSGNSFQTEKPSHQSFFVLHCNNSTLLSNGLLLMVMSLTREAFLRLTGNEPASTSPHLLSNCAVVWQLLREGVLPSLQLELLLLPDKHLQDFKLFQLTGGLAPVTRALQWAPA